MNTRTVCVDAMVLMARRGRSTCKGSGPLTPHLPFGGP